MIHLSLVFNTFLFNLARILDVLLTEQGKKETQTMRSAIFFPPTYQSLKLLKRKVKSNDNSVDIFWLPQACGVERMVCWF